MPHTDPLKRKEYLKKWRKDNKWREEAREEYRKAWVQKWRTDNPEHKSRNDDKYSWNRKLKVFKEISGKKEICCCVCGEKDKRVLQTHHINGDGNRDIKFYQKANKLITINNHKNKFPANSLEIRCANCNIIAEYDMGKRYSWLKGFDENKNPIWKEIGENKFFNKERRKNKV